MFSLLSPPMDNIIGLNLCYKVSPPPQKNRKRKPPSITCKRPSIFKFGAPLRITKSAPVPNVMKRNESDALKCLWTRSDKQVLKLSRDTMPLKLVNN